MIPSSNQLLLCTDLDRTLLPNGAQAESEQARPLFRRLAARPEIKLVYVTGRHKALVGEAIKRYQLPQADFVISDVGSSIYAVQNREWRLLPQWTEQIAQDWNGYSRDVLSRLIADIDVLHLQEEAKQNVCKLSYYFSPDGGEERFTHEIKRRFVEKNIRANLITSVDETSQTGLLDILPRHAGKLQAIQFLMGYLAFGLDEVIFAGDSGNDLDVLCSEIPAVLVANATGEVRRAAIAGAQKNGLSERLYLACGGWLGMNGNYSAGILEGLVRYKPQIGQCLNE